MMSACSPTSCDGVLLHLKNHPMILLRWGLGSCMPSSLSWVWACLYKLPQSAPTRRIHSSLSLLISLICENEILNLDGHTLDIEPLDHLLHLVDKFDWFFIKVEGGGGRLIIITGFIIIIIFFFFIFTWGAWDWAYHNLLALHLLFLTTYESFAFAWWWGFFLPSSVTFQMPLSYQWLWSGSWCSSPSCCEVWWWCLHISFVVARRWYSSWCLHHLALLIL